MPVSHYAKSVYACLSPRNNGIDKKRQSLRKNFHHNKLASCKVLGITGLVSKLRQLLTFLVNTREAVQKLGIKARGGNLRMWVHRIL